MLVEADGTVVLSRTNLTTLLAKLDGHPPNSMCTIMGSHPDTGGLRVRAEEDAPHYEAMGRSRGIMHPDTEGAIREP